MNLPSEFRPSFIHDMRQDPPARVSEAAVRSRVESETGGVPPKGVLPDDFLTRFDFKRVQAEERPEIGEGQEAQVADVLTPEGTLEWVVSDIPSPYDTAEAAKVAVKGWIERLLNQITDKYPRHEIDSWATKNEAARAVKAGTARADQTALVQVEADALQSTLGDQADLIISKADQFTAIISLTSGMRQQVGAALDAASTPAEFEAIVNAALVEASTAAAQFNLTPPPQTGRNTRTSIER